MSLNTSRSLYPLCPISMQPQWMHWSQVDLQCTYQASHLLQQNLCDCLVGTREVWSNWRGHCLHLSDEAENVGIRMADFIILVSSLYRTKAWQHNVVIRHVFLRQNCWSNVCFCIYHFYSSHAWRTRSAAHVSRDGEVKHIRFVVEFSTWGRDASSSSGSKAQQTTLTCLHGSNHMLRHDGNDITHDGNDVTAIIVSTN